MATKEKKGAKFGRHARNPSSKLQSQRTERNKRLAQERHAKRMGKTVAQLGNRGAFSAAPDFPHQHVQTVARVIFGESVRHQRYPIFEVMAGGHLIEWTDKRAHAHDAYNRANGPKHLAIVHDTGRKQVLEASLTW